MNVGGSPVNAGSTDLILSGATSMNPSAAPPDKKRHIRKTTTDEADLNREEEDQREVDQRERKAFEERLRKRDEENTKNLMVRGLSQHEVEEVRLRNKASELQGSEQAEMLKKLKEKSRSEYLKQREPKKFRELQEQIIDEKFLFADSKLTRAEQSVNLLNQTILMATKEARYVHFRF